MSGPRAQAIVRALRDAALMLAVSAAVAFGTNAVRGDGLPVVQRKDYEILVPCEETNGQTTPIAPNDPALADKATLVVDSRSKQEFDAWHMPSAINIPFDYLAATSEVDVKKVLASRASRVVVYGDGDDPDSGRELARELSGKGVRNVFVVTGGAPALPGGPRPKGAP
ncbi:MAG: rhodanese-like domain-containing protein [Deltaproteobacteria bacterium]|nr:rhodanese-like domain-containing protein [Deltaproteobacteria bacterium]